MYVNEVKVRFRILYIYMFIPLTFCVGCKAAKKQRFANRKKKKNFHIFIEQIIFN